MRHFLPAVRDTGHLPIAVGKSMPAQRAGQHPDTGCLAGRPGGAGGEGCRDRQAGRVYTGWELQPLVCSHPVPRGVDRGHLSWGVGLRTPGTGGSGGQQPRKGSVGLSPWMCSFYK